MKLNLKIGLLLLWLSVSMFGFITTPHEKPTSMVWGFYAHKMLNKLAVFTLPEQLIEFYKEHIEFITEHAVDPDKRRYAIRGEAIRHYIDLDHWGKDAIKQLPRNLNEAIVSQAQYYLVNDQDTLLVFDTLQIKENQKDTFYYTEQFKQHFTVFSNGIAKKSLLKWVEKYAMSTYDEVEWIVSTDFFADFISNPTRSNYNLLIIDKYSPHGILPYALPQVYRRLVNAFKEKNISKIIKLSADIGHYIGDAHVPLHTTKNYNGQLTNQDGIHAFWESRIPELFAETEFDFIVGQATYIDNISDYVWRIIEKSHSHVDSVLAIEKRISQTVPKDQQYCYEQRLGAVTKLPCYDYAKLYNVQLDNQVEERFRSCILAIGSIWMSAWTDAGQPLLNIPDQKNWNPGELNDSLSTNNNIHNIRIHE